MDDAIEGMVQQRLREKEGQAYCADCLAIDLQQDPTKVWEVMVELAPRQVFTAVACPCGKGGIRYVG
jgi:hypothetical protein